MVKVWQLRLPQTIHDILPTPSTFSLPTLSAPCSNYIASDTHSGLLGGKAALCKSEVLIWNPKFWLKMTTLHLWGGGGEGMGGWLMWYFLFSEVGEVGAGVKVALLPCFCNLALSLAHSSRRVLHCSPEETNKGGVRMLSALITRRNFEKHNAEITRQLALYYRLTVCPFHCIHRISKWPFRFSMYSIVLLNITCYG